MTRFVSCWPKLLRAQIVYVLWYQWTRDNNQCKPQKDVWGPDCLRCYIFLHCFSLFPFFTLHIYWEPILLLLVLLLILAMTMTRCGYAVTIWFRWILWMTNKWLGFMWKRKAQKKTWKRLKEDKGLRPTLNYCLSVTNLHWWITAIVLCHQRTPEPNKSDIMYGPPSFYF